MPTHATKLALRAIRTEDWRVGAAAVVFLLIYAPVVVFAWIISPAAGLIAVAALLFMAVVGSDTWGGSGPYRR